MSYRRRATGVTGPTPYYTACAYRDCPHGERDARAPGGRWPAYGPERATGEEARTAALATGWIAAYRPNYHVEWRCPGCARDGHGP